MPAPVTHLATQARPADRPSSASKTRNWRVIHACEYARDVLPVVEGQVAVGMHPYIVTPRGAGAAELYLASPTPEQSQPLSLLRSWQDVRAWRKSILECNPDTTADLVHAHSFASGMAAVRGCGCVVYDFRDCIDELALSSGQCGPGSWMGRSFRAAEQFILSRAAVVVVHSLGMKEAARERGAAAEHIYLVPDPLSQEERTEGGPALSPGFDFGPQTLIFLAPHPGGSGHANLPPTALFVLEAFAQARRKLSHCHLLLEAPSSGVTSLHKQAAKMGIARHVTAVDAAGASAAWESAEVIIALAAPALDPLVARRPNPVCLQALRRGHALLAADVPVNRDASPDGRGCLWFDSNNAHDLGSRMAFLGANPDFRSALASTGRIHILETRNSAAIGRKYGEAYSYAVSRRKSSGAGPGLTVLHPAANCG
jgi:hypothetical protein